MDLKTFALVFATVFVAELGDKTQLATLLFAAGKDASRWSVFAASSLALVMAAGIAVLAGAGLSRVLDPKLFGVIAGSAFVVVGVATVAFAFRNGSG